jgi:hypothetical protein
LEDLANFTVASAFEKLAKYAKQPDTFADCVRESFDECFRLEAMLYNRIAKFVYKSESGWIFKDNPEIPVSQYADEIKAVEDALQQFIVVVSGMAADFVVSELDFSTNAGENVHSSMETAAAYLCDERMPKNASIPLCVAFVKSIEKKIEDSRRNIAQSRMDGKFTFPLYWSSLPNGVSGR